MKRSTSGRSELEGREQRDRSQPVLVYGYYGAGNLGDDLLMEAVSSALENEGLEVRAGMRVAEFRNGNRSGFRTPFVSPTILQDFWRLVHETRQCSALVLGGGGVFQDTHHFSTVSEYVLPLAVAAILGKPAIAWASGIGPYRSRINEILTRLGLRLCTTVTVRDAQSAVQTGIGADGIVEDPVWWLTERSARRRQSTRRLGFVLREWQGFSPIEAADLISRCCSRLRMDAALLPFEYSKENPRDLSFSREIRDRLVGLGHKVSLPLNSEYPTLDECSKAMLDCDAIVTMRFHGAILALALDVPVCAIGCSPK